MTSEHDDNPMHHPDEQPYGLDKGPQFGKLLVVLAISVALLGVIVWVSVEAVT